MDLQTVTHRLENLAAGKELFVAVEGDEVLGFVGTAVHDDFVGGRFSVIEGLVIRDDARGRGIGRQLMQYAEQRSLQHGVTEMVVRSNAARVGAHDFYPALGYERVKTQHIYRKRLA